ncbi:S8 family peptidase [Spirosoma endophyticum]|uniref:Subtilase family protein n=1 Tax=Spirosoma endophyticum TaxID=662367 RepID=A0A1I2BBA9_9BACT|nr:S8 family peptidase [Spirosoma endophyticum]SFE53349.1 Subtilase family protein [Spirosoma endophyticum]
MPFSNKNSLIVKTRQVITSESFRDTAAEMIFAPDLLNDFISQGIALKSIARYRASHESAIHLNAIPTVDSELYKYYKVDGPEERLFELKNRLNAMDVVEAAYIKPPAVPALMRLNNMQPTNFSALSVATGNFRNRQNYLDGSPIGINVQNAWNLPGGKGTGVNIIDIERSWRFTHEDLRSNQGGIIAGPNFDDDDHGTAVLGVCSGDDNGFGIVGISPEANVSAISIIDEFDTSQAIRMAADKLNKGDIILIEVHRSGPLSDLGIDQFGYIGIEWWPDDLAAIQYAVQKGIIVVEAAGNGGQDLDNAIYNIRPLNDHDRGPFPPDWRNPFNMTNRQSGAVLVGAGLPPIGTHGRTNDTGYGDAYQDRGRCFFSNFGARVDVQGWGWEVTTTGYGDLQGGNDKDLWYTDQFGGTSSASPVIVGVLACLQGILKARGSALLTSQQAIQLLRNSGSPQQDAPGFNFIPDMAGSGYPQQHPPKPRTQRIGNRPNLQQLIAQLHSFVS